MVAFSEITREAVLKAIGEHDRLGQEEFLRHYQFGHALRYVLVHDGKFYDSKAIVGVAYGNLPERTALTSHDFSGGDAQVGRVLQKLGFTMRVSDELTADRLARRLVRLRVNRSDGIPALYQPITLLWAFGRAHRGDLRLVSWSETQQKVSLLLQHYGRGTEGDRVYYPVAALYRAGLWDLDADPEEVPSAHGSTIPQRWFSDHQPRGGLVQPVYDLVRESPEALAAAVDALVQNYFAGINPAPLLSALGLSEPAETGPLEISFRERAAEYQRRCARVDVFWRDRDHRRPTGPSDVPVRSPDARDAVLLRSGGRCENPGCSGDIKDVNDKGMPLLEVDHIHDIALGGDDSPAQMIALCPNCHVTKTRGRSRDQLRVVLLDAAKRRHEQLATCDL